MKTKQSTKGGAVTRSEKQTQRNKEIATLEKAKRKCNKKQHFVSKVFNTYVSGGTKQSRERIRVMLEGE